MTVLDYLGLRTAGQPGRRKALTAHRRTYAALLLVIVLLTSTSPAVASPRSEKAAKARAVKGQIDALDTKVEAAAERYNEAKEKHDKLVAERRTAQARIVKAKKRIGKLQTHLNTRAESMYRNGAASFLDVLLGSKDFSELAATWDLLRDLNETDAGSVADLKTAKAEFEAAKASASAREKAAAAQLAIMKSQKRSIESQLAERRRKLRGLESEIAALEAAERAREARRSSGGGFFRRVFDRRFPPPTRAPRSEVVAIAKRYLGAPYVWGAAGPNSFDCSGLTMFVYRQVGVSLPHSSRAQIGVGQRVSRSDLAPGDLVFFGSPIHHVGMYIGGGMMIHAPHSGDVVKISPAFRRDYAGACRP